MVGVVAAHTLIFTQPVASVGANAALMLLHANREVFFFVTAFLLLHSTRGVAGRAWGRFWRLAFVAGALAADHAAGCLAWVRAHGRLALALAAGAALVAEGWYAGNLALGKDAQEAADVFQPAGLLAVGGAVVALVVLADRLVRTRPANGRVWRGVRTASLIGLRALPPPVEAAVVLVLILGVTFALVLGLQRTPLGVVLTGRPGPARRTAPVRTAEASA